MPVWWLIPTAVLGAMFGAVVTAVYYVDKIEAKKRRWWEDEHGNNG